MKKSKNLTKIEATKAKMTTKKSREPGRKLKVSIILINEFKMSEKTEKHKSTSLFWILLKKSEKSNNVSKYSKKSIQEINHLHLSFINSSTMQSMSLISLGSFL